MHNLLVVGVAQTVVFSEGVQVTALVLENMDTGEQLQIMVDDDTAVEVIRLADAEGVGSEPETGEQLVPPPEVHSSGEVGQGHEQIHEGVPLSHEAEPFPQL